MPEKSMLPAKDSSDDHLTEADHELINKLLNELSVDEAKELADCKARLFTTEQELSALKKILDKTSLKLNEEVERAYKAQMQINSLRNKIKTLELQQLSMEVKNDISPKRKFICERKKPSLFASNPLPNVAKEEEFLDNFMSDDDTCKIL